MTNYENTRQEILKSAENTVKELFDRRSVRVFTGQPIPQDAKKAILMAAAEAPTAGCQQLYTILDITDQALKEKLVDTCDHQKFISDAAMVLIFCTDCRKWWMAYRAAGCEPRNPGVGDLMLAVTDTAIAAQNAVTAAWSMGIGSCYIGDILENCEAQRELLNLPDYVVPSVMLVFGYPTEQQKTRTKPVRFEMSDLVAENAYPAWVEDDYRRMFAGRCGSMDFDEWMTRFCSRKYMSDFSREMTRSVEKYLEQFR